MATICNMSMPAHEFGLAATFESVPDARITCEPVADSTGSLPLIRVRAPDRQALEDAFTNDASISEWTCLTGGESGWLYRINWTRKGSLVRRILTGEGATILSANASENEWTLRVLYPSREACSRSHTFCEERDVDVTIYAIRDVKGEEVTYHGLTDAQHTALVQAYEMGYFGVPRGADLETVAETLDISHQALSERLRRAHETMIESMLTQHNSPQDHYSNGLARTGKGLLESGDERASTD